MATAILIIEDIRQTAEDIACVLEGLGTITVFTEKSMMMPPKTDAIALIKDADLILMDEGLGGTSSGEAYSGKDLLPYCYGKKVISISSCDIEGMTCWTKKGQLYSSQTACKELRELVARTIAE